MLSKAVGPGVALLASLLVSQGAGADEAAVPEPVVALGWPGVPGRAVLLSDGRVRLPEREAEIREWLGDDEAPEPWSEAPQDPRFSWLSPGVRAARAVRAADGTELSSITGVAPYGELKPAVWLFRCVTLTNTAKVRRKGRLWVEVRGPSGLAVERNQDMTEVTGLGLVAPTGPAATEVSPDGRTARLAFDFELAPKATLDLACAVPLTRAGGTDPADLYGLTVPEALEAMRSAWRGQVVPETLTIGNGLLNEAYHGALTELLLSPPTPAQPPVDAASRLGALARGRLGSAAAEYVEWLLGHQAEDGALSPDRAGHAALTQALAEYALYSDDPPRWSTILWSAVSRATASLRQGGAALSPEESAALGAAAEVARLAGHGQQLDQWRALAVGGADGAAGPTLEAWTQMEERIREQKLPGVDMAGAVEDPAFAVALVSLVSQSLVQLDGGTVSLFPSLPPSWPAGSLVAELRQFPSGAGALSLKVTSEEGGRRLVVGGLSLPKHSAAIRLWPPFGEGARGVRVDGKALKPDVLANGPPWEVDPRATRITFERWKAP